MATKFELTTVNESTVIVDTGEGAYPTSATFYARGGYPELGQSSSVLINHKTMSDWRDALVIDYTLITVNSATFSNVTDAVKAINDLCVNFTNGGGSGGIVVPDENFFATTADRDVYFTANPDKLKEGVQAVTGTNPATLWRYDGAIWVDVTAIIRGPKGDTGATGATGPMDDTPTEGSKNAVTSDGIFQSVDGLTANFQQLAELLGTIGSLAGKTSGDLLVHKNTDIFRWNDAYTSDREAMVRDIENQGLQESNTKITFLESYTEESEYGSIIDIKFRNPDDETIMQMTINGDIVYNTSGLPALQTVIKSFLLNPGDVINIINNVEVNVAKLLERDPDFGLVRKTDIIVDNAPVKDSSNFVTSGGVWQGDSTNNQNLQMHRQTDAFRWSDVYQMEYDSIVRDANSQGLKLDGGGQVQFSQTYTVTNEYGGIVQCSLFTPSEGVIMTVSINGIEVYSTDGLPAGPTIKKSFWVKQNNVITITNPDANTFVPLVEDPDSLILGIINQVVDNSTKVNSLEGQVLDIKAQIANKILDPDAGHIVNIEDTTYTVTSALGGRLNGIGFTTLGLLGVRLISTGIVDVTYTSGNTVREYDNTSLLGAGPANPFTLDVDPGTIITSSAMSELTFTPYIAG